jgi:hypothetical protein
MIMTAHSNHDHAMENLSMTRSIWLFVGALLCASMLACGSGLSSPAVESDGVALRAAPADLDPNTCLGTRCGDTEIEPEAASDRLRTCEAEGASGFEVRWQRELPQSCADVQGCSVSAWGDDSFKVTADGTIWAAASFATPERDGQTDGVVLSSFGSDGRVTSSTLIDRETSNIGEAIDYAVSLGSVDEIHALVAVSKYVLRDGELQPTIERWLSDYELWMDPAPKSITLAAPPDPWASFPEPIAVLPAADNRVVVAPRSWGERSIALFATDAREPVWVQTREGLPPINSLVVDQDNRTSLMTTEPWNDEARIYNPRIEHYGADGQLEWIRSFSEPRTDYSDGTLAIDGEGNVIRAIYEQSDVFVSPNTSMSQLEGLVVHKLDPDGETSWALRIPIDQENGWANNNKPAVDEDGNIFIVGPYFYDEPEAVDDPEPPHGMVVYEISADGERCKAHRVENGEMERLAIAENGDFYFFGYNFGRLTRK